MPTSRFLLVSGLTPAGATTPGWPTRIGLRGATGPDGAWVAWRLLGGNNRELGRGALAHPGVEEAVAAVERLRTDLAAAVTTHGTDERGLWRWQLALGGEPAAVSARAYLRQRESHYSLAQFLAAAPTAEGPRLRPTVLSGVPTPAAAPETRGGSDAPSAPRPQRRAETRPGPVVALRPVWAR